jgi:hypothetical protein
MYEISTFPYDSIVTPTPFEPLKIAKPLSLSFFLSVDHELVHGRSQELLDRIS